MMEIDDAIKYTFTWYTYWDNKVCQKCRNLDGKTWHDQDLFASQLMDEVLGPVWDLDADQTLAHPNCRCHIEVVAHVDLGAIKIYGVFMEAAKPFVK